MNANLGNIGDTPFAQLASQPFTSWMQGMARFQAESIRFATVRAAKDMRLPIRWVACETPAQALGVTAEFAFEAIRDYAVEGQRLIALAAGDFENVAAGVI